MEYCRGIKRLNYGYQLSTDILKIRMAISTLFLMGGRITCFNYWMYFVLMILTRLKYIELGTCVLRLRWPLKYWEDINETVLIKL